MKKDSESPTGCRACSKTVSASRAKDHLAAVLSLSLLPFFLLVGVLLLVGILG